MSNAIIKFKSVNKKFNAGEINFQALKDINVEIKRGEFIGISGKSGSGKTTLLNIAGLIDTPTTGEIFINGTNTKNLNDDQLSNIRAKEIGFIFQSFNLLPLLTAVENVEYPLMILNLSEKERTERAHEALKTVGLENFIHHTPSQLSGGQRQRVAIARAIVKKPSLILADEPTANLDSKTSFEVFELLLNLQQKLNVTIMLCSHDPELITKTHRSIKISDGTIVY